MSVVVYMASEWSNLGGMRYSLRNEILSHQYVKAKVSAPMLSMMGMPPE